jgi:hypothetical protein
MTYHELLRTLAIVSERELLLYQSGHPNYFHLGECGDAFLILEAATPEEILKYIEDSEINDD